MLTRRMLDVFVPVKRINREAEAQAAASSGSTAGMIKGIFTGKDKDKEKEKNQTQILQQSTSVVPPAPPLPPTVDESRKDPVNNQASSRAGAAAKDSSDRDRDNKESDERRQSIVTVAYNAEDLRELGRETVVRHFLGVKVELGRMQAKKDGEAKGHHAYDVRLQSSSVFIVPSLNHVMWFTDSAAHPGHL